MHKPLWEIDADDVCRLKGNGGVRFTYFVDEVIRQQAKLFGIPASLIHTNLKVNQPDRGVDTRVDQGSRQDTDRRLAVPTL